MAEYDLSARLAGLAVTEHAADWVIDSGVNEFWWPRAESLKDALVAIPPRYTVVQALVRRFLPGAGRRSSNDAWPAWCRAA